MLKIKDDVDLKELEEIGYELDEDEMYHNNIYAKIIHRMFDSPYDLVVVGIDNIDKTIDLYREVDGAIYHLFKEDNEIKKHINDLIQAGLVEKVE
jgi:hypothetical protein